MGIISSKNKPKKQHSNPKQGYSPTSSPVLNSYLGGPLPFFPLVGLRQLGTFSEFCACTSIPHEGHVSPSPEGPAAPFFPWDSSSYVPLPSTRFSPEPLNHEQYFPPLRLATPDMFLPPPLLLSPPPFPFQIYNLFPL